MKMGGTVKSELVTLGVLLLAVAIFALVAIKKESDVTKFMKAHPGSWVVVRDGDLTIVQTGEGDVYALNTPFEPRKIGVNR